MERETNGYRMEVNLVDVLAAAMYCQLKSSNRDRDIVDVKVVSVLRRDSDHTAYVEGISGHIQFGCMDDVEFCLRPGNYGGFDLKITQTIKSEDVTCLVPNEHATPIWVDFTKHKVYHKWEEYLETDLEPSMVDKPKEINTLAKKIIDIVLSKVKAPQKQKYDFEMSI